jgi:preprotein translocase subunit SecE
MKEIFNDVSDWLWPFIGKIFTTVWDFLGAILHSFFENQNSIMSIIGFIFLSLLALFALDKLIRFILSYFSKYNKSDVKNITKKVLIFTFIMLVITSFVSYQTRSCG